MSWYLDEVREAFSGCLCGYLGAFLVIFMETNAGTQKTWDTVVKAMVSKVARPEHVGICKSWKELCYFIQSAASGHRRFLNREV